MSRYNQGNQTGDDIFDLEDSFTQKIATKTSYVQTRSKGGKAVYLRDNQAFIRARHPKRVEMAPSTTTSVTFGGSEVVTEFRIYEQRDMEEIKHLTLRGEITCAALPAPGPYTYANLLVEPSPLWINRIEVFVNGSSQLIQTIYGDQLWTNLQLLPTEDLKTLLGGNLAYMGSDFKVNNTIGQARSGATYTTYNWHDIRDSAATAGRIRTSVTRPFIIPLYGLLTEKFRLRALSGDTIFRIYWNPNIGGQVTGLTANAALTATQIYNAVPSAAGSAFFSIANLQMVLESEEVMEKDKMAFDKLSMNSCLYVKFLEPIVQPFNITLTANTLTPLQLTAIFGPIAFLQFYVRALNRPLSYPKALSTLQVNDNGTVTSLDDEGQDQDGVALINFTDASNKSLYSPSGFKAWDLRYGQYSKTMENELPNSVPIYTLPFCESPQAAILKGAVDGYVKFEANEYLNIRPGSGWTSGTYRVVVVAWKIKHVEIDRRVAKVI